jgi:hypothetical protein
VPHVRDVMCIGSYTLAGLTRHSFQLLLRHRL